MVLYQNLNASTHSSQHMQKKEGYIQASFYSYFLIKKKKKMIL